MEHTQSALTTSKGGNEVTHSNIFVNNCLTKIRKRLQSLNKDSSDSCRVDLFRNVISTSSNIDMNVCELAVNSFIANSSVWELMDPSAFLKIFTRLLLAPPDVDIAFREVHEAIQVLGANAAVHPQFPGLYPAVRTVGAPPFSHPIIDKVIENIGWELICSDNLKPSLREVFVNAFNRNVESIIEHVNTAIQSGDFSQKPRNATYQPGDIKRTYIQSLRNKALSENSLIAS